jgi:oxygen-independent coproporphyrinogen-3 oxidase
VHSSEEAIRAFSSAREAGFSNVSIDLIFSVPDVSEPAWKGSVERAISLQPEHISAYALTIEEGTLFAKREREGMLVVLTEDDDAFQYDWTRHRLMDAGFGQYEVSNFAQDGRESRHNLGYWTGLEYLGVGLSAHSYIGGERFWNISDIESYLQRVEGSISPEDGRERIDVQTARRERFWLGLRTSQGVLLTETEQEILRQNCRMASLVDAEFLRLEQDRVVLADSGWSRADGLAVELTDLLEQKPEGTPNVR